MPKTVYCDGTIDQIKAAVAQIDTDPQKEGDIILNEGDWQWTVGDISPVIPPLHGGIRLLATGYPLDAGTNRNPKTWKTSITVLNDFHNGDWRNVDELVEGANALSKAVSLGFHGSLLSFMGYTNGPYKKPIELSGIKFKAYIDDIENAQVGVDLSGIPEFRIHHCRFENFAGQGIGFGGNGIGWGSRGVMDHCEITNPYKDTYGLNNVKTPAWDQGPDHGATAQPPCLRGRSGSFHGADKQWAYGLIVANAYYWQDYRNCLGKFQDTPLSISEPSLPAQAGVEPTVVYIEDCWINKCRHHTASGGMGPIYVLRHSIIEDCVVDWYSSLIDAHAGGLLTEIYENEIVGLPSDERSETNPDGTIDTAYLGHKLTRGVHIRGGAAMVWGNRISGCNTAVNFVSDMGQSSILASKGCYCWANIYANNNVDLNKSNTNPSQPRLDIDFFERAPNQAQDGFTYIPYVYPHPLVSGVQPPTRPRLSIDSIPIKANFTLTQL